MKLLDMIFCDDIRFEVGNKLTIIGVYNESMNFALPKWPIQSKIGIYIRILKEEADPEFSSIEFELQGNIVVPPEYGSYMKKVQVDKQQDPKKPIVLVFILPILINNAGSIQPVIKFLNDAGEVVRELSSMIGLSIISVK